jgi:hypothetical protein
MASQSTLQNGLYTIVKNTREVATVQSLHPGADVVLLPPKVDPVPGQQVGPISCSPIRSYDILFPRLVGNRENIKWNLCHKKRGILSVV